MFYTFYVTTMKLFKWYVVALIVHLTSEISVSKTYAANPGASKVPPGIIIKILLSQEMLSKSSFGDNEIYI